MVYTHDLKSCGASLVGSSPTPGTNQLIDLCWRREHRSDILPAGKNARWWSDKILRRQNFSRDRVPPRAPHMKGIILAAGEGTRLAPFNKIVSKPLLPVYDKPMIYYPLQTLLKAGVNDILIIVGPKNSGAFLNLLGSGKSFNAKFTYEIQDKPEGIAQAFTIGADFIGDNNVALILGDNIFEDDFSSYVNEFKTGARAFAKEVPDPERFGVVECDASGRAVRIVEKPKQFISSAALTGFYLFDPRVVEVARNLKPSSRGELEVTDTLKWFLEKGELDISPVVGQWIDAGTFDALLDAANWERNKAKK